jgi:succinate dehydrogenase/fumarate reductase flavoprotein subunit
MPTDRVIVVGSGAAGFAAAIAAAAAGSHVILLEATMTVGGTTAMSGGVAWIPGGPRTRALGFDDDRDRALTYLRGLALGDFDDELVERFVDEGPGILDAIERTTPIRWRALAYPDYHAPRAGGCDGGRSFEPDPVELPAEQERLVRLPASWRVRATQDELIRATFDREVGAQRERDGVQTMGRALSAGQLLGALAAGVEVRVGQRVTRLSIEEGRVIGVETASGPLQGRVILASGGFERDERLRTSFLRAPVTGLTGGPGARGDGLRMALAAGAELGNMNEAWWAPTVRLPGAEVEGEPLDFLLLSERGRPGTLMVDRNGRRFCNEAQNYNDVGRALHAFDPGGFRYERDPAWLIVDEAYRARFPIGPIMPGEDGPATWVHADSVKELALGMDLDPDTLVATVERYSLAAADGHDPDYGRGESAYDRFVGDRGAAHPNLRPLEGRLSAVPVHAGTLGTKGGPRTDSDGRVRHLDGGVIPGLYAAGNAAASPFGLLYPGAGGTIGQALVFGHLAGVAAAGD